MKTSQAGLDLIKSFEGYLRPLRDGSCIAYRCPAGVWTLGWGCTKGIKPGMTWTKAQAEDALRHELAECEAAVTRLVTVPINQNQFDSLVSFAYNCGIGALGKSTILRKLNRQDYDGAADAFLMWDKATVNGKRVALRGLTRRRNAEKALFLEPVEPEPMPQSVEPPAEGPGTGTAVAGGAGIVGTVGTLTLTDLPAMTSNLVAAKTNTGQLLAGVPITGLVVPALIIAVAVGAAIYLGRR